MRPGERSKQKNDTDMTDFDKRLIEKANGFRRWDYSAIDVLIAVADTEEARSRLADIRHELYELTQETL